MPLLALVASLPVLQAIASSLGGAPRHWLVGLGGVAVMAVYIALLQTPTVGGTVDRVIAHTRRRVALGCNESEASAHDERRLACLLTPQVLRAPVFQYDQQRDAVWALTQACDTEPGGQFWFVEGDSGSGKTRTALLFVQSLVRDRSLCELGNRCYLYDFGDSGAAQDDLLRRLGTSRHDGAVVLVDNFQLVHADVLRALTSHLIDYPFAVPERLLVFLARPGNSWNLSPGSDVRLLSEAKAARRHLELGGPPSETVALRVSRFDATASQLVRDLQEQAIASAAQLHLAQVIARNRAAPPEVLATLRLLAGQLDDTTPAELVHVVAIVTALTMHRGTFSRRDVRRAVRVVARDAATTARPLYILRVWATFRRLRKLGLIPKIQLDRPRYIFHEAIAELCIDRLASLRMFQRPFAAVGRSRLRDSMSTADPLDAWLTATEIGAQDVTQATFDPALSRGAYLRMTRCLRRASQRYELSGPTRLQLAILLNRTGNFAESRAEFTEDLMKALASSTELAAMLATSRMEATHDPAAEAGLDVLRDHPDRLIAIVGEYWTLHMAAHRGSFDSQRLLDLGIEALGLLGERQSYWLTYSLARMHFDSLRHHYLAGGGPAAAVASPDRRRLGDYLRTRLATYEAQHLLYTKAHLVGHVLLPQLALFGEPVTGEESALAGISPEEAVSPSGLVGAAQRLYRRAADEFWQYGDRESLYLRADILNADMIQDGADLDGDVIRRQLREYSAFGAANFRTIASYPHFYFFRWCILKYYEVLLDPRTSDVSVADAHLAEAARYLARILDLDVKAGNEYGVLRAELLGVLLQGVTAPPAERRLTDLEQRMTDRGYGFEARLLRRLTEKPGWISPSELRTIFRFYPFVHQ